MRYFELITDPEVSNPIRLQKIDRQQYKNGLSEEEFQAVPELKVAYFQNSPQVEILDVLEEPAFLVSDGVKRVFALYEPQMPFRALQVFSMDQEDRTAPLYWLPWLPEIECLSRKSEKYDNGMLKKLVLNLDVPLEHEIFQVAGLIEHKVIVSMAVAESMLRRRQSGFRLVPVLFAKDEEKLLQSAD